MVDGLGKDAISAASLMARVSLMVASPGPMSCCLSLHPASIRAAVHRNMPESDLLMKFLSVHWRTYIIEKATGIIEKAAGIIEKAAGARLP